MEGEGPASGWVREYNAQNISLRELTEKIANHEFDKRKGEGDMPTMNRALDYKDADYEPGTFDDIYRARAYGLLTKSDMETILEAVQQKKNAEDLIEPDHVCEASESPDDAPVIELKAAAEPYLLKVDDGYVKISVTA